MFRIRTSFNKKFIILGIALCFRYASGAEHTAVSAGSTTAPADMFQSHKVQVMALSGCGSVRDQFCREMQSATSEMALFTAAAKKKESDEKSVYDRINVVECCVGIEAKATCDGLTLKAKADLEACRKTIGKK